MEKVEVQRNNEVQSLPEFTREVPAEKDIDQLANSIENNRKLIVKRASEFGLDPDFLVSQRDFIVGPFVSPSPISTVFGGTMEGFRTAVTNGRRITEALRTRGYNARDYGGVFLAMSEVPRKGLAAMDCLVVPKNKQENQKLFLTGPSRQNQVYATLLTSPDIFISQKKTLRDSFNTYLDRYPLLKKGKQGMIILDSVFEDLEAAGNDEPTYYLDFIARFNREISQRAIPEYEFVSTSVDTICYDPFLRQGINDMPRFIRKLASVGCTFGSGGFVKIVNEADESRVLQLKEVTSSEVTLVFKDTGDIITFSELKAAGTSISPCKELSYVLCFANMVPVVYGSQNSGGYYQPYAIAKDQVSRLGFNPNIYRVQPNIPEGYNTIGTVFDFYRQVLLPGVPYEK